MKGTTLTELIDAYAEQGLSEACRFMRNDRSYYESFNSGLLEIARYRRKHYPRGKAFLKLSQIEYNAKHGISQREASNAGN